jgi:hypothetical protein
VAAYRLPGRVDVLGSGLGSEVDLVLTVRPDDEDVLRKERRVAHVDEPVAVRRPGRIRVSPRRKTGRIRGQLHATLASTLAPHRPELRVEAAGVPSTLEGDQACIRRPGRRLVVELVHGHLPEPTPVRTRDPELQITATGAIPPVGGECNPRAVRRPCRLAIVGVGARDSPQRRTVGAHDHQISDGASPLLLEDDAAAVRRPGRRLGRIPPGGEGCDASSVDTRDDKPETQIDEGDERAVGRPGGLASAELPDRGDAAADRLEPVEAEWRN